MIAVFGHWRCSAGLRAPAWRLRERAVPRRSARGFILVAVLVIVTSSLLVATTLLFVAQTEGAGSTDAARSAQSRALLWSGLQVAMTRLQEQRERILLGQIPDLDSQYLLYEAAGRSGVVRFLPMHGTSGRSGQALLAPEAGRLDVNRTDAQALQRTGLIDAPTAEAIIAHRAALGRPLQSVLELLNVRGGSITPAMLNGPLDQITYSDDAHREIAPLDRRILDRLPAMHTSSPALTGVSPAGASGASLAEVLTVHSHEPQLQRSGKRQMNLNVPWSPELQSKIERRFGPELAAAIQHLIEGGRGQVGGPAGPGAPARRPGREPRSQFTANGDSSLAPSERRSAASEGNEPDAQPPRSPSTPSLAPSIIVRELRRLNVAPEEWPEILDAFSTEPGMFRFGRLDINTAVPEALMALPSITAEQVTQLVALRSELSESERWTIAWPVIHGVLPPEVFEAIAGAITTRCWQYRVRVAVGEVDAGEPDGRLSNPLIAEAVIDCSGAQARLAYVREVTMLQVAARIAAAAPAASNGPEDDRTAGEVGTSPSSAEASEPRGAEGGPPEGVERASRPGDPYSAEPANALAGAGSPRPGRSDESAPEASSSTSQSGARIGRWIVGE